LDERQQRVCGLLSQGHSRLTVAKELGCSWHMVDDIMRDIRLKSKQHGFAEEQIDAIRKLRAPGDEAA